MKTLMTGSYYFTLPNGERLTVTSAPLPDPGDLVRVRDKMYMVGEIYLDFEEDNTINADHKSLFFGEYVIELK